MVRFYILTVAVMLSLGCEKSRPVGPSASPQRDSPASQFDWIMQRLERAVLDFRPSERAGLRMGRQKVSHELFPPDATRPNYTARVTIESETMYVHDKPLLASDREKERQELLNREKARRRLEQQSDFSDPLAENFMDQMDEIAAEPRLSAAPDVIIENPKSSDRKVYDLAYLKGRWQLQTEPETDHERLWFEYALGASPPEKSR